MAKVREKIKDNRIKQILKKKGMSQIELADIVLRGNKSHMSLIINNKCPCISLPIAIKIARVLEESVENIFIVD